MNEQTIHEQELIDGFQAAINALPGVHVQAGPLTNGPDTGIDAFADLYTVNNQGERLAIQLKRNVFPRDIKQSIWQLKESAARHHPGTVIIPVIVADTISAGARKWMQGERIGYFDASGSTFLPSQRTYIFIDRPMTKKQTKTIGSVFEGRRALVIEALWERKDNWSGVREIAARIEASPSMVSETLTDLDRRGWIEVKGNGPSKVRRLAHWDNLLDEWTKHETAKGEATYDRYYVSGTIPRDLAESIGIACKQRRVDYEITGEYAGNLYARHLSNVSQVKCRMTDHHVRADIMAMIGAKRVSEGWNLGLINYGPGQETRFREQVEGVELASPLRTYLDLLRSGGRAKDLAHELRAQKLQAQ